MAKARMLGMIRPYTPNNRMDQRHSRKFYEKGREIADREPPAITKAQRAEDRRLEAMKNANWPN